MLSGGEKTQQSSHTMLSTTCKCFSNPWDETTTEYFCEVEDKLYFSNKLFNTCKPFSLPNYYHELLLRLHSVCGTTSQNDIFKTNVKNI